jgi:hypothetical protein
MTLRSAGVASGMVIANAVLTNTSRTACTLRGYPQVELVGASGRARPTHVSHAGVWGTDHIVSVPVAPRGHASFTVQYSMTPTGHGACPLATLRVTPPGATGSRLVQPGVVDCAGGRIWVSAVHPGKTGVLG